MQPSHPLSTPSPPALNLSQHQGLFQWISSSHLVAKVLELQLQHQSFQWIFRVDFPLTQMKILWSVLEQLSWTSGIWTRSCIFRLVRQEDRRNQDTCNRFFLPDLSLCDGKTSCLKLLFWSPTIKLILIQFHYFTHTLLLNALNIVIHRWKKSSHTMHIHWKLVHVDFYSFCCFIDV